MILRDYQQAILEHVESATGNDLVQLDTGAGKTPIIAALAARHAHVLCVAHRNILIGQISSTLAAFGLGHGIIATEHTLRRCIAAQRRIGREHVERDNTTRLVASIDSLLARHRRGRLAIDTCAPWLVIVDEAHHMLAANKWGRLAELLPNARLVGVTATPARLDGRSLHRDAEGLFDRLVQADGLQRDSVRTLIARGYLSDFVVYTIDSGADDSALRYSLVTGDYTLDSLADYVDRSTIIGDAVEHYQRLAAGRQAVAMCVTIRNAEELAEQFRAAGIPASHISSRLSPVENARRIDAFTGREIRVLCNVDMLTEGVDIPGIEALIMCRKTASLVAYRQWIGRSLRPAPGKTRAIIIDHVGNVITHGLPDTDIRWNLRHPPRGSRYTNLVVCPECGHTHFGWLARCPACGEPVELRPVGLDGAYVDLRVVDVALCKHRRKLIQRNEQFCAEVVPPPDFWGGSPVDHVCRKLRQRMIGALQAISIDPGRINAFTHDQSINRREWWIDQFTVRDLRTDNDERFLRAFKKWQSKSSTVTPRS